MPGVRARRPPTSVIDGRLPMPTRDIGSPAAGGHRWRYRGRPPGLARPRLQDQIAPQNAGKALSVGVRQLEKREDIAIVRGPVAIIADRELRQRELREDVVAD